MALRLATALPSGVLGPVDLLALRLLTTICFALTAMHGSVVEQSAAAFCWEVVGVLWGGISVFVDSVARGLAPGFSLTIVALSGNPQQAVGHRPG